MPNNLWLMLIYYEVVLFVFEFWIVGQKKQDIWWRRLGV